MERIHGEANKIWRRHLNDPGSKANPTADQRLQVSVEYERMPACLIWLLVSDPRKASSREAAVGADVVRRDR
jgi:hypothetical protein